MTVSRLKEAGFLPRRKLRERLQQASDVPRHAHLGEAGPHRILPRDEGRPAAGAAFASWSEDCAGTNPTCTLSMTQDRVAKANFLPGQLLTVQKYAETRGLGTVTSSPARLDCGPTCQGSQGSFVRNSNVTLTGECLKFGVRAGESLRESPPMTSKKKTDSALFRPRHREETLASWRDLLAA